MKRPSRKSQQNREKIIRASRSVVAQQGISNTTLQLIADEAGISKGALYYYYKTKDEILYDIMEQDNTESDKIAHAVSGQSFDFDILIQEIIDGIIKRFHAEENNRLNLYLQGEALQGNRELQKRYKQKYSQWVENIDFIISKIFKMKKSSLTRTFAAVTLAAIEGMCIQKALLGDILVDEEFLKKVGLLLMNQEFSQIYTLLEENA